MQKNNDDNFYKKRARRDKLKWNIDNTKTIINWIAYSNLQILLIDTYLIHLKNILRVNTLWSLIISSLTSTISLTQFTIDDITHPSLSLAIKFGIFFTSLFTSLITGYIKIEKIQEIIENLEEKKTLWNDFMFKLLSQIQLSLKFRKNAETIIKKNIHKYYDISTKQLNIPNKIKKKVSKILIKKKIIDLKQENISCFEKCCNKTFLCCQIGSFEKYNIAKTKRKISQYHNNNDCMKNELLELMYIYSDSIKEIEFFKDTDLFSYKVIKYEDLFSSKINSHKLPNKSFIENIVDNVVGNKNMKQNFNTQNIIHLSSQHKVDYNKLKKFKNIISKEKDQDTFSDFSDSDDSDDSNNSNNSNNSISTTQHTRSSESDTTITFIEDKPKQLLKPYIHPAHEKRTFKLGQIITKHLMRNAQDAFNKLKKHTKKESL